MKHILSALILSLILLRSGYSQVDTTWIYNQDVPYGTLDIRLAKSDNRYYYLQEDVTFSFRETAPGVRTNTYRDMTAWDSSPYSEGNLREKVNDQDFFVMNYRLLKPVEYDPNYADGYPLIIMFHGSGEKGNCWHSNCYHADRNWMPSTNDPPAPTDPESKLLNNDHNLLHGGKVYLDAVNLAGNIKAEDPTLPERAFPGFVLFPQNLNGWNVNDVQDALRLLRLIIKKYNIDEDRVYLAGLSNGGHGAYEALKRAPWMFASMVVMSAISDGFITNVGWEDKISSIPIWIFQGAHDTNPLPGKTRGYIKKFREAGMVVRYTEYEDLGHTTWNRAWKEPDFFTWLLGQNRSSLHVYSGSSTICGGGLLLELPEGFKAYQWEKDGQIISGANAATYTATEAGTYRARFSRISSTPGENDWNEWSPEVQVTMGSSPVASVRQIGTTVLNDLNGGKNAVLESEQEFAHYYWYKNGVLLNVPDTLKTLVIQPGGCSTSNCVNNGAYTLVGANYDNCQSDPTEPKYVIFNDLAPMTMQTPSNFNGSVESALNIALTWQDNSGDETGFEVWRRKSIGENQFSAWEMVTLTDPNVTSFTDQKLDPSTLYEYKIRAVSNTARSDYAPSSGATSLAVTTGVDETAPAAPMNLTAERKGLQKLQLSWNPSTDNSDIRDYTIQGMSAPVVVNDTMYLFTDLVIDSTYRFTVVATDLAGNQSEPSNTLPVTMNVSGLFYEHTPGSWPSLDSVNWNIAENTGWVDNFTLAPKTQEDYFNFRFDGFLYITTAGDYAFKLGSNDGSRLWIKQNLLIDNDGIHELATLESSALSLSEGAHRITVEFFDYTDIDTLIVEYKGPDTNNEWVVIPSTALRSNVVIGTEPTIENPLVVDVFPNPGSQHEISVRVESIRREPLYIEMLDGMGRSVYRTASDPAEARGGFKITPEAALKNGFYILKVNQAGFKKQVKVIIRD